jgi:exosome complex exonuclease DIS3/RRP44
VALEPQLAEMVATPAAAFLDADDGLGDVAPAASAASAMDEDAGALSAAPGTVASSLASAAVRRGGLSAGGRRQPGALYREHWSEKQVAEGRRVQAVFQGTLRTSRDCWFEARTLVHGLGGSASADATAVSGGDDVVPVLISGRGDLNRAMEGDVVAIELLPRCLWRAPSRRMAVAAATGAEAEKAERELALQEQQAADAAASAFASARSDPKQRLDEVRAWLREKGGSAAVMNASRNPAAAAAAAAANGAEEERMPTGRVVGIIRRAWRQYCGSLEPPEDSLSSVAAVDGGSASATAIFVPVDQRVPRIRIETRQKASLLDKRIVVAIDAWDADARFPRGHYVRTLGVIGDKATETEVVLLEHDIPSRPFSQDVLACLPPANFTITPANSAGRRDLRNICICSVDPPGCKDIDDALHARPLPNGNIEVGVHIADVTHFVKHGTAIDIEAAMRANTTYLVERRLDMLPGLLTESLCSLKQGVDRFAFSVLWQFRRVPDAPNPDTWEVVPGTIEFFKSIIHSRAAMTYANAQAFLDDPSQSGEVADGIRVLASIARSLKRRRKEAGALSLASTEVRFMLDSETHEPLDVSAYEMKETNSMVEEFMLLANCEVAKKTVESFPRYACLRRHPAPPKHQFASLLAAAEAVGVSLKVDSGKEVADSLDAAVVAGNPYFNKLLRILATRCMMQAAYFSSGEYTPEDFFHYGLAAETYTHFTSPIRRYADVVVHRLLSASLGLEPLPSQYEDKTSMKALCDNMNKRHLMSQLAGRASVALHTNIFFKDKIVIEPALVMRVKDNGCAIVIPRLGLEAALVLNKEESMPRLPDSEYSASRGYCAPPQAKRDLVFSEKDQTLALASDPSVGLRVFDEVRVAVFVEERVRHRKELAYRLIDPAFHTLPAASTFPAQYSIEDRTQGRQLAKSRVQNSVALKKYSSAASAAIEDVTPAHAGSKRSLPEDDNDVDAVTASAKKSKNSGSASKAKSGNTVFASPKGNGIKNISSAVPSTQKSKKSRA